MSVSVAAGTFGPDDDFETSVSSPLEKSHSSWRAHFKRRSAFPNAALATLIPLLVVLALTIICFPRNRRTISRSHATAGRRLAAGHEEKSDEEGESDVLEACLDLEAEIGFSLQQALSHGRGETSAEVLQFLLHSEVAQESEQDVVFSSFPQAPHDRQFPLQPYEPQEMPSGSFLEFPYSQEASVLPQRQSPPSAASSALNTPVVSPVTPSYSVGSYFAFPFEEGSKTDDELSKIWGQHQTGEKRKLEDEESSDVEKPLKRQQTEQTENLSVDQFFRRRTIVDGRLPAEHFPHVVPEALTRAVQAAASEGSEPSKETPATFEKMTLEAYAISGVSEGAAAFVQDSASAFTVSSASSQATPEVAPTSPDLPSTSSSDPAEAAAPYASSLTQGGAQFSLPPPPPPMPRNTHLYYRLPVVTPKSQPVYVFDVKRAFSTARLSKLLVDELRDIREILACETLALYQERTLVKCCERLVNILLRDHTSLVQLKDPRHAAEQLGRRYLSLEALFCSIQILGPSMNASAWWPAFLQQIPTFYWRDPFTGNQRTVELTRLALRLNFPVDQFTRVKTGGFGGCVRVWCVLHASSFLCSSHVVAQPSYHNRCSAVVAKATRGQGTEHEDLWKNLVK
ncbi:hypothetical protein Esti_006161 [Eimeria stiedai]